MFMRSRFWRRIVAMALGTMIIAVVGPSFRYAQDVADPVDVAATLACLQASIDSTFVFVASCVVFFMQAGFAFLEAGMLRQTGVVNSMMENFMDAAFGGIAFFATGFALALGADNGSGLFGTTGFFLSGALT